MTYRLRLLLAAFSGLVLGACSSQSTQSTTEQSPVPISQAPSKPVAPVDRFAWDIIETPLVLTRDQLKPSTDTTRAAFDLRAEWLCTLGKKTLTGNEADLLKDVNAAIGSLGRVTERKGFASILVQFEVDGARYRASGGLGRKCIKDGEPYRCSEEGFQGRALDAEGNVLIGQFDETRYVLDIAGPDPKVRRHVLTEAEKRYAERPTIGQGNCPADIGQFETTPNPRFPWRELK